MSLWRRARTEVAAAWRSVRHDLGRPGPNARPGAWLPQVTPPGGAGEQFVPAPRRLVAVSAFGVLAVAGAAGSYFAVINVIDSLAGDRTAGAEPYPLAAETPGRTQGDQANTGLGRGTATTAGRVPAADHRAPAGPATTGTDTTGPTTIGTTTTGTAAGTTTTGTTAEPAPGRLRVLPATAATAPVPPEVTVPWPRQTIVGGEWETGPPGCCPNPPVPTPTLPPPSPHSTSVTPSPTASSPNRGDSPEPSRGDSPTPNRGDSPTPNRGDSPAPSRGDSPAPSRGDSPESSRGDSPEPNGSPNSAAPDDTTGLDDATGRHAGVVPAGTTAPAEVNRPGDAGRH